jgi:hypothetical protein
MARTIVNMRLQPCHASLIGSGPRSNSGSLAMLAAMRPGLVEAELVDRDSSSKPFGPTLALRIRKIAVEAEAYFLHDGTNAEMKGHGRLAAVQRLDRTRDHRATSYP